MKRLVLWTLGILTVLAAATVLAFRFSPWPAVAVIRFVFSKGDQASEAALEKHVPARIVSRRDIAYGPGADEVLDLYYQEGASARPVVVWVHGGGFVAGSKDGVANYVKVLAGRGYTTIAVEYSRGCGAKYPKPVEQVNAALGFIMGHAQELKADPTMVVLAGDSAGAHITSQVAMLTTDPAYARSLGISPRLEANQLSATLLLSGIYDPSALNFEGPLGWFLKSVLWAYADIRDVRRDDPRIALMSVTAHITGSFPESFISTGNGDPLAPQAIALEQKLSGLGVKTDALFFPADRIPVLRHEYQFNLDEPAGQEALSRILVFLDRVRARTSRSEGSPEKRSPP